MPIESCQVSNPQEVIREKCSIWIITWQTFHHTNRFYQIMLFLKVAALTTHLVYQRHRSQWQSER